MTDTTDLFKLSRVGNKWISIRSELLTSEYLVVLLNEAGDEIGEIIKTPNLPLALEAVQICRIAFRDLTQLPQFVPKAWKELAAKIDKVPQLSHTEASARRHEECQKKALGSLRQEPLVTFGRVSCTRRSIESFQIVREKETVAIVLTRTSGERLVCWSDVAGRAKAALGIRDVFVRLANQQLDRKSVV